MDIILHRLQARSGMPAARGEGFFGRLPDWLPGQILQGRVAAVIAAGTCILNIDGREILAASPVDLPAGDVINLVVQERQGSRYIVKLLQAGEQESASLEVILARLGFPDTPRQRSIIQGFLAQKLPLKPELFRQAESMLRALDGSAGKEEVATVIAALKRGLQPREDVLQALRSFINMVQGEGQPALQRLPDYLPRLAGFLAAREGSRAGQTGVLYQQLLSILTSLPLKPEEGTAAVAEQLRHLLAVQVPSGEGRSRGEAGVDGLPENRGQTINGRDSSSIKNLLAVLEQLLQEVRESTSDGRRVAPDQQAQFCQAILQEGEEFTRQLAGQHLWQLPAREGGGQDYFYFLLPLAQEGKETVWGRLTIKKDERGQGTIDPRDFAMTMLLPTENLGLVQLDINVWQREIRVQGKVQEERAGRIISRAWPALQAALGELGYHLYDYRWQVAPVTIRLLSPMVELSPAGIPGLLDQKV